MLHVHDALIGSLGALSWVNWYCIVGLATQGWMMYMATGLSSIGGLTSTPIVTLLSKLVEPTEFGAIFALVSGMPILSLKF